MLEAVAHDGVLAEHAEVVARGGDHLGADGVGVGAVRAARRQVRDAASMAATARAAGGGGVAPAGRSTLEVGHDGMPARRPKTMVSSSELPPSRLAPCTLTQAHSPAA